MRCGRDYRAGCIGERSHRRTVFFQPGFHGKNPKIWKAFIVKFPFSEAALDAIMRPFMSDARGGIGRKAKIEFSQPPAQPTGLRDSQMRLLLRVKCGAACAARWQIERKFNSIEIGNAGTQRWSALWADLPYGHLFNLLSIDYGSRGWRRPRASLNFLSKSLITPSPSPSPQPPGTILYLRATARVQRRAQV